MSWERCLFGSGRVSTAEFKPDPNYCSDPSQSGAVPFLLHNRLPDSGRIRTTDRIRHKLLRARRGSGSALSLVREILNGCTLAGGPALEGRGFTRLLLPPLPLLPVWPPRVPPRLPRAPTVLLLLPRPRPLPKLLSRCRWDSRLGPAIGPAGGKCLSTRRCHLILACAY